MNTALNMQVISLNEFRKKQTQDKKPYTDGERLLSMKEVTAKVGVSRASIDRWEKAGKFPPKFHIGTRIFWMESEIDNWLLEKKGNGHAQ